MKKAPLNRIFPLLIISIATILLSVFRQLFQSPDSLQYAATAVRGEEMLHPHHLLFTPILHFLHSILPIHDILLTTALHNGFWFIVILLAIYGVALELFRSPWWALFAAFSLMFGMEFIRYSSFCEVYIPATACVALMVYVMIRAKNQALSWGQIAGMIALFSLAVFYHQTNVLFAGPMLLWFFMQKKWRGLMEWAMISGVAGGIVLGAYIWAVSTLPQGWSVANFHHFIFEYVHAPYENWGTMDNISLKGFLVLARSQSSIFLYKASDIFSLLTIGIIIWHGRQKGIHVTHQLVRRFLLSWLVFYYAFFWWWLPGEKEFFITPALPLVLLFLLMVEDVLRNKLMPQQKWFVYALGMATIVVLFAIGNVKELHKGHRSQGEDFAIANELMEVSAGDSCRLMCPTAGIFTNLLMWHDHRNLMGVDYLHGVFYNGSDDTAYLLLLEEHPCYVLPLIGLQPDYRVAKVNEEHKDEKWRRYIEWAFQWNPEDSTTRVYRLVEVNGNQYLRFDAERQKVESFPPKAFFP